MSLHFVGIRDFPILHRQFSSPPGKVASSQSPASSRDLARDSKDVLIQRLNDLSFQLMSSETLEDEAVATLHVDVDRMEAAIRRSSGSRESSFESNSEMSLGTHRTNEEDVFWGPLSPGRNRRMKIPDSPTQSVRLRPRLQRVEEISSNKAMVIARQAEELMEKLMRAVEELKERKEETDHIHGLLITRAEAAARRTIELEERVKDLAVDLEENQSEVSFLGLQLKALEIQGMEYIPADEDLSESIKNWKLDWADVDQRTKARRRKCKELLGDTDIDDSQTIVDAV